MRAIFVALIVVFGIGGPAKADDEAEILAVIDRWYAELTKTGDGHVRPLTAPAFIDASPHFEYRDTGAVALGPRIYTSLAARAQLFAYDVDAVRIDPNFARVQVWERGYFYAGAAQTTYELAASTRFVMERQQDSGKWLILAHQSSSVGIPPNKVTDPMPDLSPGGGKGNTVP